MKIFRIPIMLIMTACLSLTACQRPLWPPGDYARAESPSFHFPSEVDSLPTNVVWLSFSGNMNRTIELPSGEYVVPASRLSPPQRQFVVDYLNNMFGHLAVTFVDGTPEPTCKEDPVILFGGIGQLDLYYGGYTTPATNTSAVFTDALRFTTPPIWIGEQDFALGVANVAAHEFGHLLGAHHVDDPKDVMWGTPDWSIYLHTQEWKPASQGEGWQPSVPKGCP